MVTEIRHPKTTKAKVEHLAGWPSHSSQTELFLTIFQVLPAVLEMSPFIISASKLPQHSYMVEQYINIKNEVTPEKAMAPHSSTLAWKIPRTEEPGRLRPMGSGRVGHD